MFGRPSQSSLIQEDELATVRAKQERGLERRLLLERALRSTALEAPEQQVRRRLFRFRKTADRS